MLPVRVTLSVTEGALKGEEYVFHDSARCVVGRSPDCDIALPMDLLHRDISRHHCAFEIDPPTVRIRDLDSLNGTYVNRRRIESHRLDDGDEIQIGKYKLSYLEK